jgi:hypothetical protein
LDLDPGEMNNLFGLEAYRSVQQKAEAIMEKRFGLMGEITLPSIARSERPWADFRALLEGGHHHRIAESFHIK